jgi:sugar lactone lactonase YvrE
LPALLVASGCSQGHADPLRPSEPAIVWPAPPSAARVRFLGILEDSDDVAPRRSLAAQWNALFFGPEPAISFAGPYAIAVDAETSRVAITDTQQGCVHVIDLDAQTHQKIERIGEKDQQLEVPVGIAWVDGSLWIADAQVGAIASWADGGDRTRWLANEAFVRPAGMAYCESNELCYVTDADQDAILAIDHQGQVVLQIGTSGSGLGEFNHPSHVAIGQNDTLIVADSMNFRVQRLGLDGRPISVFGRKGNAAGDLSLPKGVATDSSGNIWVVDAHFENVQAFTPEGQLLLALGREGTEAGEFWLPSGLCVDERDRMWVADSGNHRVQVFELLKP